MKTMRDSVLVRALVMATGIALTTGTVHASPYSVINAAAAADPIVVRKLRGGIAMLSGSGGNITVITTPEGMLLVDVGIAVSKAKIQAALRSLGPGPVRYVINTHWHWDHSDGNAWLHRAGATILADRHARARLSQTIRVVEWEHTFTPIARRDLPSAISAADKVMTFGRDRLTIRHYRPGHTDGDIAVQFRRADVLATGDTFWNGMYPFIDYVGGGGIDGAIRAANANIALAGPDTQVVPGHGPLGNRAQLIAFRDMLVTVRRKVAVLKARGLSADQVVAQRPTAALDPIWGRALINGELFTRLVYRGV